MKKIVVLALAAMFALGASALAEDLVALGENIAMPKSMNAKVGLEDIPCVAIQVPHSGGGYVSVSCGGKSYYSKANNLPFFAQAICEKTTPE